MNERNIDSVEQIDDNEEERIKRLIEEESQRRANAMATKIFKKNRREIKRLNDHAAGAVLENNFEAYKYALCKLSDIYKQPYNDEIIRVNWQTTRQKVWEIINAGTKTV
ncbi:hypothetical protein CG98_gp056 [Enterobacter phage PG7]|uniref:Uncharacterized protein n=1 Tax=Enterobacter phage PG7 TaxID=1455074 RepID=W6AU99_9CAUD|nr:hypothetical protein CG98_gp056 [Enterobacter phage PG7]AHI60959.1 hypothetical protein PG7_056 [Enterobacter phage PG7]